MRTASSSVCAIVAVLLASTAIGCAGSATVRGEVVENPTVVTTEPPAPQVETVNERKGYFWVKGHWEWRSHAWAWTQGRWEKERDGQHWNEGRWDRRGSTWVWVEGSWATE